LILFGFTVDVGGGGSNAAVIVFVFLYYYYILLFFLFCKKIQQAVNNGLERYDACL